MGKGDHLGEFEHLVMLALLRLKHAAYGMRVRREIQSRTERSVAIGSVYATLERLQAKGMIASTRMAPDAGGGKPRRLFRVESIGEQALVGSRDVLSRMWQDVSLAEQDIS